MKSLNSMPANTNSIAIRDISNFTCMRLYNFMFYQSHVRFILIQRLVVKNKIDIDVCGDVLAGWLNRRVSPSKGQIPELMLF